MVLAVYPTDESLIFDNALAYVVLHSAGYVRIEWRLMPVVSTEFRAALGQVLALLHRTGLTRLLVDNRNLAPVWAYDCAWLLQEWAPAVAGCRCAVVENDDALVDPALDQLGESLAKCPLYLQRSSNGATAIQWLLTL